MPEAEVCSVEGCEREHKARGFCQMHYQKWRKYGDPLVEKNQKNIGLECSVAGCELRAVAKGYCDKHYTRLRETGSLEVVRTSNKGKICSVERCDHDARALGYCNSHYKRFKRYGDPLVSKQVVYSGQACSVEGCEKKPDARGYCKSHYNKLMRHGDPVAKKQRRNNGKVCSVEGCEREHKARGWCSSHHYRWKKYGSPTAGGAIGEKKSGKIEDRDLCRWPEGCESLERARGLCGTHYQAARYSAKWEHLLPEEHRSARCLVSDCKNPQYAWGFCRHHNNQRMKGVDPLAEKEEVDYDTFGGRLFAMRMSRGWTLDEAGKRVGVSRERVRQFEMRDNPPQAATLAKLAEGYGVGVERLLGDQIPGHVGSGVNGGKPVRKRGRPKRYEHLTMRCLWCSGKGYLPPPEGSSLLASETVCAYCRGSGFVHVGPAPAPPRAEATDA
jgi:transcriptional regulator with XRE-family HTH domain